MKKLTQFQTFDFDGFVRDKSLIVRDIRPWYKYENGEITNEQLGIRIDLLVMRDDTEYRDEEDKNINFGETFTVKVENQFETQLKFKDEVIIKDATAVVYGQYQNQLSVTAKNVITKNEAEKDD